MSLHLTCPSCSKAMRLSDSTAGHTIKCPRCQTRIKVLAEEEVITDVEVAGTASPLSIAGERLCPHCQAPLESGWVVCIECGYDRRTGNRRKTKVVAPDDVEVVGSKGLGTYTEYTFRHEEGVGWVLIVDGWAMFMHTSHERIELRKYREVRTSHFWTDRRQGTTTLALVGRGGRLPLNFGNLPVKWLLDNLQFKAGLAIRRE